MTTAGIALIAGGLATLIGFRRALWAGNEGRRRRRPRPALGASPRTVRALETPRRAELTAAPARTRTVLVAQSGPPEISGAQPAVPLGAGMADAGISSRGSRRGRRRGRPGSAGVPRSATADRERAAATGRDWVAATGRERAAATGRDWVAAAGRESADDERWGLASIGLADHESDEAGDHGPEEAGDHEPEEAAEADHEAEEMADDEHAEVGVTDQEAAGIDVADHQAEDREYEDREYRDEYDTEPPGDAGPGYDNGGDAFEARAANRAREAARSGDEDRADGGYEDDAGLLSGAPEDSGERAVEAFDSGEHDARGHHDGPDDHEGRADHQGRADHEGRADDLDDEPPHRRLARAVLARADAGSSEGARYDAASARLIRPGEEAAGYPVPPARRPDDRRYGDRVDGWVRPRYDAEPDGPAGDYWTPVPEDAYADPYGWPVPVERLPTAPPYPPAAGFDPDPLEEAEPTAVVPQWPPARPSSRIEVPRTWSASATTGPVNRWPIGGGSSRQWPETDDEGRGGRRRAGAATEHIPAARDSTQTLRTMPGPHAADRSPHIGDRGPYVGDPGPHAADRGRHPSDRGSYAGDRGPHSGDRGSYAGDRGPHSSDRGSYAGDRGPHSSDRGSYAGDRGPHSGDRGSYAGDRGPRSDDRGPHVGDPGPRAGERRRPRPRPNPSGEARSTVYVSRHAAEPR